MQLDAALAAERCWTCGVPRARCPGLWIGHFEHSAYRLNGLQSYATQAHQALDHILARAQQLTSPVRIAAAGAGAGAAATAAEATEQQKQPPPPPPPSAPEEPAPDEVLAAWASHWSGQAVSPRAFAGGAVVFPCLRGEWFVAHPRFQRMQELPREAFCLSEGRLVVFCSHRWTQVCA